MMKTKNFNISMAVFSACIFGMWIYLSMFSSWYEIPDSNRDLFVRTLSTCENLIAAIGMYLFGSTVTSRINAETIATIAKGTPKQDTNAEV